MSQLYSQTYDAPWGYDAEEVLTVSPLIAQGVIEEHNFPSSVNTNVNAPWSLVVHNIGILGRFAAFIVNVSGNPGDIKVTWFGKEWILPPTNQGLRIYSAEAEPNCTRINAGGQIAFAAEGTYSVRILAQHEEDPDVWFIDDERSITVNVVDVIPPEWPHTVPIHIFDNVRLKAEWWEIGKAISKAIIDIDTTLLLGGKLDYTVRYTQGTPLAETANIAFNGTNLVSEYLSKGEAKSGTIDLTGLIGRTADIRISIDSAPGFWSEVSCDIWLTLGFSEEPPIPPGPEPVDWLEWLTKNAWWMSLGVLGVGLIIMSRPSFPFVIYQPQGEKGKK